VSAIPPAPVAPQPFAFNQITPGSSLVSQLEAAWGTPAASLPTTTGRLLTYLAPGFRQIDVEVNSATQKVESLVIHLNEPAANDALASQLGLAAVRPVAVRDEHGTALGQGYPERGVLLGWAAVPGQVTQIVLEPVGGELFRLRAEQDVENRCELSLADLRQAVQFNPQDARAHWMLAELLWQVGRAQDAREACATAVKLDAGNSLYQLTQARLLSENGDLKQALRATQTLAEAATTPPLVRARAEYQWGNLMVMGPEPNLQEATTHHLKAIELASKSVTDPIAEDRRMAKDLLLDAHLAVAQDIALGNYQRQKEVVPKWLSRAKELAEDLVSREQGDPILQMEVYRTMLAANSVLDGNFDATSLVDSAIQEGQRLLAQSSDRLYQQRVERELSELLYHAARIEQRCGRMTTAMQLVSNAVVLAESSQLNRQLSLFDQLMNGQLYFLAGSLHALQSEDHEEAVRWFERSIPAFNNERLPELVDCTMFGDPLVSMGVSYWEVGQREKAVELTQAGAELMQQGVQAGLLEMSVLSVPYGNLAAMHRQMGNTDEAQHYATLLAKIESEAEQNRR
jgi:tetratricopeptide (TPR) repeat protein